MLETLNISGSKSCFHLLVKCGCNIYSREINFIVSLVSDNSYISGKRTASHQSYCLKKWNRGLHCVFFKVLYLCICSDGLPQPNDKSVCQRDTWSLPTWWIFTEGNETMRLYNTHSHLPQNLKCVRTQFEEAYGDERKTKDFHYICLYYSFNRMPFTTTNINRIEWMFIATLQPVHLLFL